MTNFNCRFFANISSHELFTKRRRTPGSACSKPLQRPAWVKNDYFMLHKQDPARLVHYDTKNEPILPKTYQECQLPSSMSSLSHEGCDKGDQNYDPRGCPNKASWYTSQSFVKLRALLGLITVTVLTTPRLQIPSGREWIALCL